MTTAKRKRMASLYIFLVSTNLETSSHHALRLGLLIGQLDIMLLLPLGHRVAQAGFLPVGILGGDFNAVTGGGTSTDAGKRILRKNDL
jgi:hypothetical protein